MGATGPPGGLDIQNFFKGNPYPPQSAPYQAQALNALHVQPPLPYPPNNNFTPSSNFPSNANSFPSPLGPSYNTSVPPQMPSTMYHPYLPYPQDYGPRPTPCPSSPFNQSPPSSFSQPTPLPHSAPPLISLPLSSLLQVSRPNPGSSSPLDGARLMALLTTQSAAEGTDEILSSPSSTELPPSSLNQIEVSVPPPAIALATPVNLALSSALTRLPNSKLPRGRHMKGERIVYDVDEHKPGEAQPQLEVSPITVYSSDPVLVVGKQIAVNKKYICYGLRGATIRILNINTALRALLRGHTERVTDLAFFAEDVNLLASASTDGRVIIRNIAEGRAEDGRVLITEQIVLAMQFVGDWVSSHPLLRWNYHTQDFLVVAVGKYVLTIDVSKVRQAAPPGGFNTDQPLVCHVENPLEGINVVGTHDEDVADLSIPFFVSDRIASASQDGTVRVWGEKNISPLSVFTPHQGEAVGAVAFLSAPHRPELSVLLTAGPLNRELKLWAPDSTSRTGSMMWQCIQTLEFTSSAADGKLETAFFNHVLVASRASLILVANSKRNAIYTIHFEFGATPVTARMDYVTEFAVTMPILSLMTTEETVTEGGEGIVQIYCVQTQAIQQYALNMSQCLPPHTGESIRSPSIPEKHSLELQAAATTSTSASAPVEKMVTSVVTKASMTVTAVGGVSVGLTPNVPPGLQQLSSGVGNRLDSGHRYSMNVATEMIKSSTVTPAKELKDEPGNLSFVTKAAAQPVSDQVNQPSTIPVNQQVGQSEVASGVPPTTSIGALSLRRHLLPKSPPNTAVQRYVPVSTSLVQQESEELESQEKRGYGPVDSVHSRQPSDKLEGSGDSCVDAAQTATEAHFASSSSSNSLGEELLDKENREGPSGAVPTSARPSPSQKQPGSDPPHLITPSELMSLAARSMMSEPDSAHITSIVEEPMKAEENSGETRVGQDEGIMKDTDVMIISKEIDMSKSETGNPEVEVASGVFSKQPESSHKLQVGVSIEYNAKDSQALTDNLATSEFALSETYINEEVQQAHEVGSFWPMDLPDDGMQEHFRERILDDGKPGAGVHAMPNPASTSVKGRRNKNKANGGGVGITTTPLASFTHHTVTQASSSAVPPEVETSSNLNAGHSGSGLAAHVASMQDSLNQLITMQNELQKQMAVMVAVPVAKEGKRMEGALGQRMEKVLKAHVEAMWARLAEENAKREKSERERVQQVNSLLSNFGSKDMPLAFERVFKKESVALGPVVSQAVLPQVQKAISTAVIDTFQKAITEKVVPQLEKIVGAKLETTVTRQLQTQFQTVGKQTLQDILRSCFETSLIPAFERSCRGMFEQVDSAFQCGMAEHTSYTQKQFTSSHSALVSTLQDTVASASSLADSLKIELVDSHRKLVALVENAGTSAAHGSLIAKQTNGTLPNEVLPLEHLEESLDPTVKLGKLLCEGKLEEAFTKALSLTDVTVVSWLCDQVDPVALFASAPLPLSQGVLLSLVQQLGCDLGKDTSRKLTWIREAALALNPNDPVLAPHMRPFLEQLYQNLHRQMLLTGSGGDLASAMRLVIHVVNSLLTSCK